VSHNHSSSTEHHQSVYTSHLAHQSPISSTMSYSPHWQYIQNKCCSTITELSIPKPDSSNTSISPPWSLDSTSTLLVARHQQPKHQRPQYQRRRRLVLHHRLPRKIVRLQSPSQPPPPRLKQRKKDHGPHDKKSGNNSPQSAEHRRRRHKRRRKKLRVSLRPSTAKRAPRRLDTASH
jgi:hypothetical protein